mmetsp:Transcript_23624/g.51155  ORF Transcript_23624/g.51155 Transcript_23624/m.51155 type:complete len:385 (-) Transcript_23624:20-1174(-)
MQNRLVLTGIPSSVPRLPNALDSLKEFVEDHACWVDRFAFLTASSANTEQDDTASSSCVAAVELHIENVRDKAVKSLDGLVISMDLEGDIIEGNNEHNIKSISFQIHAQPATRAQATELIQKCPIQSDDAAAENRMEKQKLQLPLFDDTIALTVRKSDEHGGTGTFPWRGGLILSRQICHWAARVEEPCKPADENSDGKVFRIDFKALFCSKKVLELGAGAAGLPSMTLGKIGIQFGYEMELITSDGVDEIVSALRVNISDNGLDGCIEVKHLDWNDYTNVQEERENITRVAKADTIIFADCIYNEECAISLSQTIFHLLKPGGNVIGVLPDFRVGLDLFEKRMKENHFTPTYIPIIARKENDGFACSGGGGKDYRLVLWRDCR